MAGCAAWLSVCSGGRAQHRQEPTWEKAVRRARRLIYIEDQFLWSNEVVATFVEALKSHPDLRILAVVPRYFDQEGVFKWPSQVGREQAMKALLDAAGDRVGIFDVENAGGTPVYVHAKVCVIDDVWAAVGSDNFNRRSWTHDSEVSCAVFDEERDSREPRDPAGLGDGARRFARDLRLTLWREHLGRGEGDDMDLVDPAQAVQRFTEAAEALERWHQRGQQGERLLRTGQAASESSATAEHAALGGADSSAGLRS